MNSKELSELKVGSWYWVQPTNHDTPGYPDYLEGEEWQAEIQPARYAGGSKWWCVGIEEASDWPMCYIGSEIDKHDNDVSDFKRHANKVRREAGIPEPTMFLDEHGFGADAEKHRKEVNDFIRNHPPIRDFLPESEMLHEPDGFTKDSKWPSLEAEAQFHESLKAQTANDTPGCAHGYVNCRSQSCGCCEAGTARPLTVFGKQLPVLGWRHAAITLVVTSTLIILACATAGQK
jgi:hypothetical protein